MTIAKTKANPIENPKPINDAYNVLEEWNLIKSKSRIKADAIFVGDGKM
jgi:hypothetical protein